VRRRVVYLAAAIKNYAARLWLKDRGSDMQSRSARFSSVALILISLLGWCGCGTSKDCKVSLLVSPAVATADHAAPFPGNTVQFIPVRKASGDCAIPAIQPIGTWTTSDAVNTSIDRDTGLATCIAATPSPVTIRFISVNTAEDFQTATLTCR
jgi:hypothetical protein